MKNLSKLIALSLSMILLPACCSAEPEHASLFHPVAIMLSYLNYVLVITSIISIKQFFWPANNRIIFHFFNLIFIILYYLVSLNFLILNKQFYEGYETLSPLACMSKVFLSYDFSSLMQLFILCGLVVNLLYIARYRKDYYGNNG